MKPGPRLPTSNESPSPPALREASIVLGERLEDIQIHDPALNWEPLRDAWKTVEREAGSEAWD